ncbi:two-component sensor histidine kinase, partial [Streptomyces sp. TRM76130]|nr:two-component sensor histidine kinase [Streptomyces sp. TRM76130]
MPGAPGGPEKPGAPVGPGGSREAGGADSRGGPGGSRDLGGSGSLGGSGEAGGSGVPGDASEVGAPSGPGVEAPRTPGIGLQVNALQAMCRQVFGFRLAMIAVAAPAALLNAGPGVAVRLVGAAVVVTFMGSYVLFRDWERFGPLLLRHPTLLAVDTLFGALLLVSAGPDTTLAYVSVCTPLLAGLVYGWRGAAVFASLQSLILLLAYATARDFSPGVA